MKQHIKHILGILLLVVISLSVKGVIGVVINKKDGTCIRVSHKDLKSITPNAGKGIVINKNDGTSQEVTYSEFGGIETYSETLVPEITPGQEVDLGLSVKWAGWNVGANTPEQYGGYYAWGETEEKSSYDWNSYKFWQDKDGDGYCDSNEFINIGSNISGTQYDVATVKWGNGWRMPTVSEVEELLNECTWKEYSYNGEYGWRVTGPNGNSIFLPATGCFIGSTHANDNMSGDYWSSSMDSDFDTQAYRLYLFAGTRLTGLSYRSDGRSVRPVRD